MNRLVLALTLTVLFLCNIFNNVQAQPCPRINNIYDTLCNGDNRFGYTATGVYRDTFHLSPTCDSIRITNLVVLPKYGSAPNPSFFNTATNGSGGRLPGGSNDSHWQLSMTGINGPYTPAIVMSSIPGSYYPSPWPDCTWISHVANGAHNVNVDVYYKIDFILPCFDTCSGLSFNTDSLFCLGLDFFADNSVFEIYVNGVPQSPHIPGIPVSNPYGYVGFSAANRVTAQLCDNWKSGYNSLIVYIKSGPGYEGFLCQTSVNVPPTPTINAAIEPVDTNCAPYTVTFVNNSTGTATYSWDFGDGSPLSTTTNPTHTYATPGSYTASLYMKSTLCNAQYDTATVTVAVGATPAPQTIYATICEGETYTYNGIPYTVAGTYPATYKTAYKCDSVVNLVLTINPLPNIVDSNIHAFPSCKGASNGAAYVTRNPGDTTSYAYTWKDAANDVLSTTDKLYHVEPGNYKLDVLSAAGCLKTLSFTITEEEVAFTVDSLFCAGTLINFDNTSSPSVVSTWYFGDGDTTTTYTPTHWYKKAGVYRVKLVGVGQGCTDSVFRTITIEDPITKLYFTPSRHEICIGETVTYTPYVDNPVVALLWNFGVGDMEMKDAVLQYSYEQSGMIIIKLKAKMLICPELDFSDTIRVHPFPLVNLGPDTTICLPGEQISLINLAPGEPGQRYKWNTGDSSWQKNTDHYGTYALTVISAAGCKTTDSVEVREGCYLAIPNVFSPNGDGVNDYFFPRQLLSESVTSFKMQLYNRWGQVIFESANINGRGWDGTYNGAGQPQGVYVYLVDVTFRNGVSEKYQGNVTLMR